MRELASKASFTKASSGDRPELVRYLGGRVSSGEIKPSGLGANLLGNIKTTPEEIARVRFAKLTRIARSKARKIRKVRKRSKIKANRRKSGAGGRVYLVSGGLPGLGKRR